MSVNRIKESVVESELVRRVVAVGGTADKVTIIGSRGYFDRLIVLPGGRVVFAECKRPRGGILSRHQMLRAQRYRALGAEVALVKNFEDIDTLLADHERRA